MPDIPRQLSLPRFTGKDVGEVETWGDNLIAAFIRVWTILVQTVNALSQTDTLAVRQSVPDLDHIFFTESDSLVTSVAVAGVWEHVGPRRGNVTINNPATTVAVTLTPNEPDANYRIAPGADYNAGFVWTTVKATTGFTLNVTTSPGASGVLDFMLMRD